MLVNGAAGGVGVFALQLGPARRHGHGRRRPGQARAPAGELGADRGIDTGHEDFTHGHYDVIVDIPGNQPFAEMRRALAPDGIYVLIAHDAYGTQRGRWMGSFPRVLPLLARSLFDPRLPGPDFASPTSAPAGELTDLVEAGQAAASDRPHLPASRGRRRDPLPRVRPGSGKVAIAFT